MQASRNTHRLERCRVEPLEDRWLLDGRGVVSVLSLAVQAETTLVRSPNPTAIVEPLRASSSLNAKEPTSSSELLATKPTSVSANSPDLGTLTALVAAERSAGALPQLVAKGDPETTVSLVKAFDSSVPPWLTPRSIDLLMLDANSQVPSSEFGPISPISDQPITLLPSTAFEPVPIGSPANKGSSLPQPRVLSLGDPGSPLVLGVSAPELSRLESLGINHVVNFLLTAVARNAHEAALGGEAAAKLGNDSGPELPAVVDEFTANLRTGVVGVSETLHSAPPSSETPASPRSAPETRLPADIVDGEKKSSATSPSASGERSLWYAAAVLAPASSEESLRSDRSLSGLQRRAGIAPGSGENGETPDGTQAEVAGDTPKGDAEAPRPSVLGDEPPGPPKGAGLLTDFRPVQLGALEATLQMFGQELQSAGRESRGTLFWAGISCACLTAAAVAVGAAKRRQSVLRLLSEKGAGHFLSAFDTSVDVLTEDGL